MNSWLFRSSPHGTDRFSVFMERNIIAIGWPDLPDLSGKKREEIREKLIENYPGVEGRSLANDVAVVDLFVNKLKIGDYVLIPNEDQVYFAEVKSEYRYKSRDKDEGFPHQRKVTFIGKYRRDGLSQSLRNSLRTQLTAANLSKHKDHIDGVINVIKMFSEDIIEIDGVNNDPLNEQNNIMDSILRDAMTVLKTELNHDDPERRIRAAVQVLKLNNRQL